MRLHLGVLDMPHGDNQTTGGVASILEDEYHVMQIFFDLHGKEIAENIESGIAGAIENLIAGRTVKGDMFAGAMGKTEKAFRLYLDKEEMAGIAEGVPTQAALDGVNARKKKKKGAQRPSFMDSWQYRNSFKSWVE